MSSGRPLQSLLKMCSRCAVRVCLTELAVSAKMPGCFCSSREAIFNFARRKKPTGQTHSYTTTTTATAFTYTTTSTNKRHSLLLIINYQRFRENAKNKTNKVKSLHPQKHSCEKMRITMIFLSLKTVQVSKHQIKCLMIYY